MNSTTYQIISFLMQYPDQERFEALSTLREEIEMVEHQPIKNKLQQFIDHSMATSVDEWVDQYIEIFDFGKMTNLYVTYLKLGEQRERGLELLKLKSYYQAYGFDVTDKELPDYLPLMLEFCAQVPFATSNELLQMHVGAIQEIRGKLVEAGSYYVLLFDALAMHMENNGVLLPNEHDKVSTNEKTQ
ncbi:nitrate reductase molybdenum cofactor assembly chaperone [Aquibacillus sediminis]|uniref:nitrate reductase molybdenum cofactor assembly chaperone n=1 Tax=Aquibacillus sediminis TaxID=2574734 RepID=UPI00110964C7|nr:nitrate reductase molybdenum cofactor assembly chaperone [Aquibacillus sediminis]